jgi:hypothetical protein
VPSSDYVLGCFSGGLQRDVLLQGRFFLTQNRICFYSNIIGFVNILVIHLKDIIDISKQPGGLQTAITIKNTSNKEYILKFYSKGDLFFQNLSTIWKNISSENPASVQTLLNILSSKLGYGSKMSLLKLDEKDSVAELLKDVDSKTEYKLPSSFEVPKEEVVCNCKEHLEKVEVDTIIPASAKQVYEIINGSESELFWEVLDKKKGIKNKVDFGWSKEELPTKQVEFVIPMDIPMLKSKEVDVKQTIAILKKEEYFCYVIESRNATLAVPFGDCFLATTRFCITWKTENSCRLIISVGLVFIKSTMMKAMIKSNGMKPLCDAALGTLDELLLTINQTSESPLANEESPILKQEVKPLKPTTTTSAYWRTVVSILFFVLGFILRGFISAPVNTPETFPGPPMYFFKFM